MWIFGSAWLWVIAAGLVILAVAISATIARHLASPVVHVDKSNPKTPQVRLRQIVVPLTAVFVLALCLTLSGIYLLDSVPPSQPQTVGETLRDVGVALFGGLVVGAVVAVVQREFDRQLASRMANEDTQLTIDLTLVTQSVLDGIDLSGLDLTRHYLANKSLQHAQLGECNLAGSILRNSNLSDANLTGADLTGADLTSANLSRADLIGADLSGADLSNVRLNGIEFDETTRWPDGFDPSSIPKSPPDE